MFRRRRGRDDVVLTLFFATDLHGSDVCFRKFLNARRVYGADVMILGGDLTGKLMVPIVREARGRFNVMAPGEPYSVGPDDLDQVQSHLTRAGFYPWIASPEEIQNLSENEELFESTMSSLLRERLVQWSQWADDKLQEVDAEILVAPGNDDPWEIDEVLRELPRFRLVEGSAITLGPSEFEMLSTGFSNPTPWRTPRELEESDLETLIDQLTEKLADRSRSIFNVHVPPYGSQLDEGPMIDWETLKVKQGVGQEATVPVGSKAVRAALERHQPMLSLHGHIHESRGTVKLGRTLAINPGSDYGDGILRGALVELGRDGVVSHQLTSG